MGWLEFRRWTRWGCWPERRGPSFMGGPCENPVNRSPSRPGLLSQGRIWPILLPMARSARTTDGLGSAGTLAVLAIVLHLWVAGAAAARAEGSDRMATSIVQTLREVVEHAAPPMPKASTDETGEITEASTTCQAPNQPEAVIRSGRWLTTVPPPAIA